MRIHRIRLKNYRGIEKHEVEFQPDGITVVEGPNEAGKSCLAEALNIVLDELDSTRRERVKALKPVDKDVGPEVEVEVESGPYRFTLFKRFLRKRQTTLKITAPHAESLTGREAHNRVQEMLDETLDRDLWRALCVVQGTGVSQVKLPEDSLLSTALDMAAGTAPIGEAEVALFEVVEEEYGRYYTATGREKALLKEMETELENAEGRVAELEERAQDVEGAVERSRLLRRSIQELDGDLGSLRRQESEWEQRWQEVSRLRERVERLEAEWERAKAKLENAQGRMEERTQLIDRMKDVGEDLERLTEEEDRESKKLDDVRAELNQRKSNLEQARNQFMRAKAFFELRQGDNAYLHDKLNIELLRERKERIDTAKEDEQKAKQVLKETHLDDDALERVRQAHQDRELATQRLEDGGALLKIRALSDVALSVGDGLLSLTSGDEWEQVATGSLSIVLPEVLELRIRPGKGLADLPADLESAEQGYADLLARYGVDSLSDAVRSHERWQEAKRKIARVEKVVRENLRDLTHEEMESKVMEIIERIGKYEENRQEDPPLPDDLDDAKKLEEDARTALAKAESAMKQAEAAFEEAESVWDALREKAIERRTRLEIVQTTYESTKIALERTRSEVSDEELEARLEEAKKEKDRSEAEYRSRQEELVQENPEEVQVKFENARDVRKRAESDLRKLQDELTQVSTRLEMFEEEGIFEDLQEGRIHLTRTRRESESLRKRAKAAKLLYQTLTSARDEGKRAYVRPLRERIERLAKLVFGETLQVELDEDLTISSRTLDGVTVPYESLSTGAKEQLSVIVRLACAMTVSEEGGVPLLIDDALGYSDPGRLESMGAVFNLAGRDCQVIVLTCMPDRYRHVGTAEVKKFVPPT